MVPWPGPVYPGSGGIFSLYLVLYRTVPCTVLYRTPSPLQSMSACFFMSPFWNIEFLVSSMGLAQPTRGQGVCLALTRSQGVYFFKCAGGREHFITILNIFTAKQFTWASLWTKNTCFFEHLYSKTICLGPENRVKMGREGFLLARSGPHFFF